MSNFHILQSKIIILYSCTDTDSANCNWLLRGRPGLSGALEPALGSKVALDGFTSTCHKEGSVFWTKKTRKTREANTVLQWSGYSYWSPHKFPPEFGTLATTVCKRRKKKLQDIHSADKLRRENLGAVKVCRSWTEKELHSMAVSLSRDCPVRVLCHQPLRQMSVRGLQRVLSPCGGM